MQKILKYLEKWKSILLLFIFIYYIILIHINIIFKKNVQIDVGPLQVLFDVALEASTWDQHTIAYQKPRQ